MLFGCGPHPQHEERAPRPATRCARRCDALGRRRAMPPLLPAKYTLGSSGSWISPDSRSTLIRLAPDCSDDRATNRGERSRSPAKLRFVPLRGNISELILEFKDSISGSVSEPWRTADRAVPYRLPGTTGRPVGCSGGCSRGLPTGLCDDACRPSRPPDGDVCGKLLLERRRGLGMNQAHAGATQRDRACPEPGRSGCGPLNSAAEPPVSLVRRPAADRKRWSAVHS